MRKHNCGGVAVAGLTMLLALTAGLAGQESAPRHNGVPQDWSSRKILFSRDGLAAHPEVLEREPRVLHQAIQRWSPPEWGMFRGVDPSPLAADRPAGKKTRSTRDWNVIMGSGKVSAFMFPAKYSFDPGAPPDCTNDYVVFGLAAVGATGGQANLVAFNNLYSGSGGGFCGFVPTVLFAYNTSTVGGKIVTSPILSLDGSKIAFVESVAGTTPSSTFHVITWNAGDGSVGAAVTPPSISSLTISSTANITTSSPYIDYNSDTAYVGTDNGSMYKINGVFHGTPTLAGGIWPSPVSSGSHLSPPVLDAILGKLMVGSTNGTLYQIDTGSGLVASLPIGLSGANRSGVVAPPMVDVSNGTTFAVSANDGTSAVLVEADTSSFSQLAKARIGQGSTTAGSKVNIHEPGFTNQYYNDPSSGDVRVCGTGASDTTPWQYAFGFTGRTMRTTVSFSQQLLTSTSALCTGWTEFFNPNVGGGTDFFFFGLTQDCTGSGTAFGCVAARVDDSTINFATVNGGPSGIVIDNYSTDSQASSLYLGAEGTNYVYKYTQDGLQ